MKTTRHGGWPRELPVCTLGGVGIEKKGERRGKAPCVVGAAAKVMQRASASTDPGSIDTLSRKGRGDVRNRRIRGVEDFVFAVAVAMTL